MALKRHFLVSFLINLITRNIVSEIIRSRAGMVPLFSIEKRGERGEDLSERAG